MVLVVKLEERFLFDNNDILHACVILQNDEQVILSTPEEAIESSS